MNMKMRMKVSKGGQVSIPARIRHRWNTTTLTLEDQGDQIVLKPAADDPVASVEGALAEEFGDVGLRRLRDIARADERLAEARRSG